jgi:uncharacterized repeat protein (TIGR01451 family)
MPSTGIHANTPKYLFYAFLMAALFLPVSMALAAPAGTLITNQASVSFHDNNANTFSALSNSVTVTVTSVYTVSVTVPPDAAGPSNTVVYYPYTVTNTGNDNNTFTLTAATGSGFPASWTATIYFDANGDGVHDPGETTVTSSTGVLAPNGTYKFFVGVTIPINTPNGTQDDTVLNVNGTGAGAAATAQDNVVTTAQAPTVTVVKAVRNVTAAPGVWGAAVNAKPAEVLEYRLAVTNGSPTQATQVVLTDTAKAWTAFIANSMWIGSNNAAGNSSGNVRQDDNATIDAGENPCAIDACGYSGVSAGNVTAYLGTGATETAGGTLSNGSTVYVFFQVTVQ